MNNVFGKSEIKKRIRKLKGEKQHRVELKFNTSALKVIDELANESKRSRKNFLEYIIAEYCIKNKKP